jgi:hypothetical protein
MQSVQSYKRTFSERSKVEKEAVRKGSKKSKVEKEAVRKGSKKSRVEKETVSKRSSPVKQPSQKTQAYSSHQRREVD